MNNYVDSASSEEINLFDVWRKLVQYKKIFWSIFFIVLVIGVSIVFLTPPKYSFSQVIEIGQTIDERGQKTMLMTIDSAILKAKKVFYPAGIRAYNLQTTKKIYADKEKIMVEKAGDNTLLLSFNGRLKDLDKYKTILQKVVEAFVGDTKDYIDSHIKSLNDSKLNLEKHLADSYNVEKKQNNSNISMSRIYIEGQNASMLNNVNTLQNQILGTYNTRAISDLVVSDLPVGPSKFVLLILIFIAAFVFALFGVFIGDFVNSLKTNR